MKPLVKVIGTDADPNLLDAIITAASEGRAARVCSWC
jgi:hypothetical protein